MPLTDDRKLQKNNLPKIIKQNILMENREKLKITGVLDVESFNEDVVIILTDLGKLNVKGINLKVNNLNLESSELQIEGFINLIEYIDKKRKTSILNKGFKNV